MIENELQTEAIAVFRRFDDPLPYVGAEYLPVAWVALVSIAVGIASLFVIWLYWRSRHVAGFWGIPLTVLRISVFALLGWAFLLPAIQTWEITQKKSRVILVLDVSPSLSEVSDDTATGNVKPKTRMQKVLDVLNSQDINLLAKLLEKNPVHVYRFGSRLDEESQLISAEQPWTDADWQAFVTYDFKPWLVKSLSVEGKKLLSEQGFWGNTAGTAEWAITYAKLPEAEAIPGTLSEEDRSLLKDARAKLEKRVDVSRAIVLGTNYAESLSAVLKQEAANLVRGVIVFSDGRSNLGSESALKKFTEQSSREKIPVFTIAVGESRENISVAITDLQAPDRAPPDEQFKVTVEADGVGLADFVADIQLDIYLPGNDPKAGNPDAEQVQTLKFLGETSPPHGSAEFIIDPEKVPASLLEESKITKKKVLKQGAWSFRAKVLPDSKKKLPLPLPVSVARVVQVIDKPLRILLFASAGTREYQTLRTLLVREVTKNRAELSICLQSEGAKEGQAVQDVPPERMLVRFPTRLDTTNKPTDKPEEKYYNLNEYDLVIAFDPDWSELTVDQVQNIQSWVNNLGGGFIYVAGPLNTFQLARADEGGRLKPMLDLLPVLPDDIILVRTKPIPRTPRRLTFKPNPEYDVLRLEDDQEDDPIAGWEQFFSGRPKYVADPDSRRNLNPRRGMFSYYPVKIVKPGASTLAEFIDLKDSGEPDPKPWLVVNQPARGRCAFLASGETWRLRETNQDYFDRFWVKLSRYIASNRDVKASRGRILINKEFSSGSLVRVQTRLLAPNGNPYEMNAISPKFTVTQLTSSGDKVLKEGRPQESGPFELKPKKSAEFDGYYTGQVLADPSRFPPGDFRYRITVDVPDSPGDTLTAEFQVRSSNPELDNTRPDFAALLESASTLDEVSGRLTKDDPAWKLFLGSEREPNKAKLSMRLSEVEKIKLIPNCIDSIAPKQSNRGPVYDQWDKPARFEIAGKSFGLLDVTVGTNRVEIPWLIFALVGLLGLEWTARKLLRMA
jgi:hypothetical protein